MEGDFCSFKLIYLKKEELDFCLKLEKDNKVALKEGNGRLDNGIENRATAEISRVNGSLKNP